jgi:hypothetical protein
VASFFGILLVMRKAVVAALLLLVLGIVLGFTMVRNSSDTDARAAASLALVRKAPLTVRGEHFRPSERVRLRVMLHRRTAATAGPQGSFVASFQTPMTRCDRVRVIAIGSEGSHAVLKLLPPPACIAATTPASSN